MKNCYSLLIVGRTQSSTESKGFKNYVGVGNTYILAVNPTKAELEKIYGREVKEEPSYVTTTNDGVKEAHIHFITRTDPAQNNGIEITNRLMFTLRQAFDYNKDKTKVRAIDDYGNTTWASVEDVEAKALLKTQNGTIKKIDDKYRKACFGEADLVAFLKKYLGVPEVFQYIEGNWSKSNNHEDGKFALQNIKNYFNGDFSELKDALSRQPNNKVNLLYGVKTGEDNKQRQVIASRGELIMYNNAGSKAFERLDKELAKAKGQGFYTNVIFKVQPLQEYTVEATNLDTAPADDDMPWD